MYWRLDWARKGSTGTRVWSKYVGGKRKDSRRWKLRSTGYLRSRGVNTPTYRKNSWEVEWRKRKDKKVWARNLHSKMPTARNWHWVDFGQIKQVGLCWKPVKERTGRYLQGGYVLLNRRGMTNEEIALCEKHGLFRGSRKIFVREHHLVMVKKIGGALPTGSVVRHLNGIKSDNAPENLVLGTTRENTADHNQARLMAMYWRGKYEELLARFTPEQILKGEDLQVLRRALSVRTPT